MSYPYDSRTPIRPGIVSGVPRQRIEGLNSSQVKAMRNAENKTPVFHRGGPFSLGMISTVRASYSVSTPIPTRPVYTNRTPGRKRSIGTSCRGPSNTVFQAKCKTAYQKKMIEADQMLSELLVMYRQLLLDTSIPEEGYEAKRDQFLLAHGHTHHSKLERMEAVAAEASIWKE